MSVGGRIREERLRLGISQPAFAALANATKSALVKWEKDAAAPNARALIAWAEAGADVLYVLVGRRTTDLPLDLAPIVEAQLASIKRDVLDPSRSAHPGETAEKAETRLMEWHAQALSNILQHDTQLLPRELADEAAHLLDIVTNPAARTLYRAGDFVAMRTKRREMKTRLAEWFHNAPYQPSDSVANLLTTLALEYDVPVKLLVELVQELHDDVADKHG